MINRSAVPEADRTQEVIPGSRSFVDLMSGNEDLTNAGCIVSNCANLCEVLEAMNVNEEGEAQSWCDVWKATADLAQTLAERTDESLDKGGS